MDKVQNGNYGQQPKKAGRISNIIALIICFMMAIVMWLYVMQTESPEYEETFTRVPLVIENVADRKIFWLPLLILLLLLARRLYIGF